MYHFKNVTIRVFWVFYLFIYLNQEVADHGQPISCPTIFG